jgi:hypothetical protein
MNVLAVELTATEARLLEPSTPSTHRAWSRRSERAGVAFRLKTVTALLTSAATYVLPSDGGHRLGTVHAGDAIDALLLRLDEVRGAVARLCRCRPRHGLLAGAADAVPPVAPPTR